MADWTFELVCPRCGHENQLQTKDNDPPQKVNCGNCLMETAEIVEMEIVKAIVEVSNGR